MLSTVMREKFGESRPPLMDDHLEYQLLRLAAGEISWAHAIECVMRSPYLPATLKAREAVRISIKRARSRLVWRRRSSARPASSFGPPAESVLGIVGSKSAQIRLAKVHEQATRLFGGRT